MAIEYQLAPIKPFGSRSFPVAASTKIEKSDLVMIDAGYAKPLADSAGVYYVGYAYETVDNTSGGAGDLYIDVMMQGSVTMTISGVAQTDVGKTVWIVDQNTGQLTANVNGITVGIVEEIIDTDAALVNILPPRSTGVATVADVAGSAGEEITYPTEITSQPTLSLIALPSEEERKVSETVYLNAVAAASTDGAATQEDISAGGATFSMSGVTSPTHARNLVYTVTDGNASITAGTITATGICPAGTIVTEVIDVTNGLVQTGEKIFLKLVTIEGTGFAGNGAGDTVDVGFGNKLGLVCGGTDIEVNQLTVFETSPNNAFTETPTAVDQTYNSFTPATVPDGSTSYSVVFKYKDPYREILYLDIKKIRDAVLTIVSELNQTGELAEENKTKINEILAALKAVGILV